MRKFDISRGINMKKIIEVHKLSKRYGSLEAVKNIDFYVEQGKLFAFLGPNGAGKSTTINILCTLLTYDEGEITIDDHVLGKDNKYIREQIGIVFQDSVLDPLLTVRENLLARGSFYNMKRNDLLTAVDDAMRVVDISDLKNRRYDKLSGGQRRRVDIARALIHHPKILFLDEPTTGLDPQTRRNVWNTILNLQKEKGMTIFLTTHYMEEAAEADYIIVIDKGEIAAKGTPTELREKYSSDSIQIKPVDKEVAISILNKNKIVFKESTDLLIIYLKSTVEAIPLIEMLKEQIITFQVLNGTMDDAFIGITGKEIRG